ncbi:MAG: hypothetical protein LLG04_11040 [Parachlamydia sp.]|nr:hypothetical protein [Parachlamydia sp.]
MTSNSFVLKVEEKCETLLKELSLLTRHHLKHCPEYARLFHRLKLSQPPYGSLAEIPYLPSALFKSVDLLSVPKEEVFKTLLSSGTRGSTPSRVYLDRETAQRQTVALATIVADFIGSERLPILIVDTEDVIRDHSLFSARGAALVGMLTFGRDPFYLLDRDLVGREAEFQDWRKRHLEEPWLIFGFTSMVWKYFIPFLNGTVPPKSIVLHGGGWKRMEAEGITNQDFKFRLKEKFGIERCYNYYGMVEQTGSIYMECEEGVLHASDFSEIIFRNPDNFEEAKGGEVGVVQTLSVLPKSYPGHSLLTEDLGREVEIDRCPCGRKGKTFQIVGRVPQAEPRGCSDVG